VIVSFKGKIKLRIHPIECGKMAAFPALKTFAEQVDNDLRCICQIFYERLIVSLDVEQIYPFSQLDQNV